MHCGGTKGINAHSLWKSMAKELNAKIESKIMDYLKKRSEQSSITEISRDLDIGRNTVAKNTLNF